jgi:GntR family transcriptional regulator
VTRIAINPNTVSKAYRELEHEGLVAARAGVGTFVTASTSEDVLASLGPIRHDLEQWLVRARTAGFDDDSIEALFRAAFRNPAPVAS